MKYKFSRADLPLAAILLVGGALRFYDLGSNSIWFDEAYSVWTAHQSLPVLLRDTVTLDAHPPLYYTLLHFWVYLGDSEFVVRALSALLSTLTLPVMYLIGARLGGRPLGLLATFILAISPLQIQHAQNARMYALLTFTAACAVLCLIRMMDKVCPTPGKTAPSASSLSTDKSFFLCWAGLILFTTLTMLGHNTAIFFPCALGLFYLILAFFTPWRRGAKWGFGALALSGFLWLPWLPFFFQQSNMIANEFWMPAPTWNIFLETCRDFLSAFAPGDSWLLPLFLFSITLVALGAWHLRRRPVFLLLLLLLLIVPFAGELLVSLKRPIFYTRTLIWASIPLYLLFAAGILQLRLRPLMAIVLAGFAILQASSLRTYYREYEEEGWRSAVAWLAPQVQPGDLILLHGCAMQLPFDYYFRESPPNVVQHGLPSDAFDRDQVEPKVTAADLPPLAKLLPGHPHVWLISSHNGYTDPHNLVQPFLASKLDEQKLQPFNSIIIREYTPR